MLYEFLAVFFGIALLVWSADRFVFGAAATADHLKISPLVIGLVIMGFGTSAPELLVSSLAAVEGNPGLGIGNAIGSNIANIALVLGMTALIMPISVHSKILRREIPLLMLVTAGTGALLWDGSLDRIDGILLAVALVAVMAWLVSASKSTENSDDLLVPEFESETPHEKSIGKAIFWTIAGLLLLLGSSKLVVWGAVGIAQQFGVSDLVIGLTIVAIGTSLPELAASITAALKNEHEMAVGNVVGSNMFNTLGVIALPGIILPGTMESAVMARDFPIMVGLTVLLCFMATFVKDGNLAYKDSSIGRIEGAVLLSIFVGYLGLLYMQSVGI